MDYARDYDAYLERETERLDAPSPGKIICRECFGDGCDACGDTGEVDDPSERDYYGK